MSWNKKGFKIDYLALHTKEEIFDYVLPYCNTARERILLLIQWFTGKRIGEIAQLKVKDINFLTKEIFWNIEKKREKHINTQPMHPDLEKELKEYIEYKMLEPDNYLFESKTVTKLIPDSEIKRIIKKIRSNPKKYYGEKGYVTLKMISKKFKLNMRKAMIIKHCYDYGLNSYEKKHLSTRLLQRINQKISKRTGIKINNRGMRHSINTHLRKKKVDIKVRMKFNHHSNISTTARYDIVDKTDVREAIMKI